MSFGSSSSLKLGDSCRVLLLALVLVGGIESSLLASTTVLVVDLLGLVVVLAPLVSGVG